MESKPDLILSIYPNPSLVDHELNYSTQIVKSKTYYPDYLQNLIDKINVSTSPIQIEQAIDDFTNFVETSKKELLKNYQLYRKRENINQRTIYIVLDENNTPVLKKNSTDLIHVGGPVGGGTQTFDHDLTETIPDKWNYLIEFDDQNVAQVIQSIEIEKTDTHESGKLEIFDSTQHEFGVQNLPFKIGQITINIQQASVYFEQEYQQTSTLNDFAPLIDSSFTAAEAILHANLIYFNPFPNILVQKMKQYGISMTHQTNFLTIQNIKIESHQKSNIKILGYSFSSNQKEYSFTNRSLFKDLKLFLLAENDINAINILCETITSSSDLNLILTEFESMNQTFGTRGTINQFQGRKSERLRDIIGVGHLQNRLDLIGSPRITIPIGFVNLTKSSDNLFFETNFSELELPDEFLPALENIIQPLDLLSSGPLKLLKYDVDEISIHLEIGEYRFRISKNHDTDAFYDQIIIYYNINKNDLGKIFRANPDRIPPLYIEKMRDILPENNFDSIIEEILMTFQARTRDLHTNTYSKIYGSKQPVTLYAERILTDHVTQIPLSSILKEISKWEDGIRDSQNITKILTDINRSDQTKIEISKETDLQRRMERLNREMDEFNEGFYSFVMNSISRDFSERNQNDSNIFHLVNNIFQDVKVAIVDSGLSAKDWVYADNLQIWNSYLSQIRYLQHSLTLKLSDVIGTFNNEGEMEHLTTYPNVKNMVFTSFNGAIEGHNYVILKKAYLYLLPKLEKYEEELKSASSIYELLGLLESMEEDSRSRVRATLPPLPKMTVSGRY